MEVLAWSRSGTRLCCICESYSCIAHIKDGVEAGHEDISKNPQGACTFSLLVSQFINFNSKSLTGPLILDVSADIGSLKYRLQRYCWDVAFKELLLIQKM